MSEYKRIVIEPINDGIESIIRLGINKYSKADIPLSKHTHKGSVEICYLYKGEQQFYVYDDNTNYELTGGDIFISYPDEQHDSGSQPMQKSVLYWIILEISNENHFLGYNQTESRQLIEGILNMKKRYFRGCDDLKKIFEDIIDLYIDKKDFYKIRIRNLMTKFIIKIIELEKQNYNIEYSSDIKNCIEYIQLHVEEKLLLSDLAKMINLSLSRFKQKFKQEIGMPPNEYIQRLKIEKAKKYFLQSKQITVTEVAHKLSFCSSQYFCDTFKKFTKQSPTQFRNRY